MKKVNWSSYATLYETLLMFPAYIDLIELFKIKAKELFLPDDAISILEIGCGTGYLSNCLSTIYPNCNILGIDRDLKMLKIANRNKGNNRYLSFRQLDFNELDKLDGKFELIVMNNVLYTASDKEKVLRLMQSKLKANGLVMFSDPIPINEYNYWAIFSYKLTAIKLFEYLKHLVNLLRILKINKEIDYNYTRFTKQQYSELLLKLNYNIVYTQKSYAKQANFFIIKPRW